MASEERDHRAELAAKRIGTVLRGKYHLDEVLGVGGMAAVYRATHRNRAEYAVKMLLPEHSTNEAIRRRFLREGYAANSVKHPGAVRVVDDDVSEDGVAFLVLELLDGSPCDRLAAAAGGRLPVAASSAIALQVLDVLDSAHAQGIIHRDIKPANLFLLRDGTVKVLDFGIARVRESMAQGGVHTPGGMTSGTPFLGTPAFMAPEQALGLGEIDARVDVWAVGALLFALASGATVHEGRSGQQIVVHLLTRPARSLAVALPGAPEEVVAVVDRALLADREARWPSARAMKEALEGAVKEAFGDVPLRATLAEWMAAGPGAPPAAGVDSTRVQAVGVASTLPAATPQAVVQTSGAVSREGSLPAPARRVPLGRVSLLVALTAALTAGLVLRGRSGVDRASTAGGGSAAPAPPDLASRVASGAPAPADEPPASTSRPPSPSPLGPPKASVPSMPPPATSVPRAAPPQGTPDAQASGRAPAASVVADTPSPSSRPALDAAAPPNCKPPFYFDSQYNRVFKKECLQN